MVSLSVYVAMRVLHLTTAGVWAGWTVFMAALVVPAARDERLDAGAVTLLTHRFTRFSQVAPLVMLITGGYMMSRAYADTSPLDSGRGTLVVTMVVLWLVLSVTANLAGIRLERRTDSLGVKEAAGNQRALFAVAAVVSLSLLLVGGWL